MAVTNPYTLTFGTEPLQSIPRASQSTQIIEEFSGEYSPNMIFMITGVRGSGKTVFMTEISRKLAFSGDWITIELNPERDMLTGLASKLSSINTLTEMFRASKINLSLFGLGLEISGELPITDIETAISRMLGVVKKAGKRVLVTVDEVTNTKEMRVFASAFQILIRQDLPLYLLMTGLYDNINNLQNEDGLTFLYRAPKVVLSPLNTGAMADNYHRILNIDTGTAMKMARMTKGYPFAFQVLGYFTWRKAKLDEAVINEYKLYLEEFVYEKIWSELSRNDKKIIYGIAMSDTGKINEIRDFLGISTNQFNPYRRRLIRKGLIDGDTYGYVSLKLPLFERFVRENYDPEM